MNRHLSGSRPAAGLDWTIPLERTIVGAVSIVPGGLIFMAIDHLRLGGQVEEVSLPLLFGLCWIGAEIWCRRSWSGVPYALGAAIAGGFLGWALRFGNDPADAYLVALCMAVAGISALACREWRSVRAFTDTALAGVFSGGTFLILADLLGLIVPLGILTGGALLLGTGSVSMYLRRGQATETTRNVRFSLAALSLFVFLLAGEVALFFALGYGDALLPFDAEPFRALGARCREHLDAREQDVPIDPMVEDWLILACLHRRPVQDLIEVLGPHDSMAGQDQDRLAAWSFRVDGETQRYEVELDAEQGRAFKLVARGPSILVTSHHMLRERAAGLLVFLILLAIPLDCFFVWLFERLRRPAPPAQEG